MGDLGFSSLKTLENLRSFQFEELTPGLATRGIHQLPTQRSCGIVDMKNHLQSVKAVGATQD